MIWFIYNFCGDDEPDSQQEIENAIEIREKEGERYWDSHCVRERDSKRVWISDEEYKTPITLISLNVRKKLKANLHKPSPFVQYTIHCS